MRKIGPGSSENNDSLSPSDLLDSDAEVDPVITLTVRAYDDGIPSLSAEVPVHIFTEDVSSRMMRFIVPQGEQFIPQHWRSGSIYQFRI